MRDRSSTSSTLHPTAAAPEPGRRFRRRWLRGYDVHQVDDNVDRIELRLHDSELEAADLREDLLTTRNEAAEVRHDLTRAKAELRYWNDRASYVDTEVARARRLAAELEQTARERADAIEADAQERSIQLVDRVCTEANAMLIAARQEAREMFLRYEHDVEAKQAKLEQLEAARGEIATAMQDAIKHFEDAVREVNKVSPAKTVVARTTEPTRRAVPTFGQRKAMDAAKRFEDQAEHGASASMSSPVPSILGVSVHDVTVADLDAEPVRLEALPEIVVDPTAPDAPDAEHAQGPHVATTGRRVYVADDEIASLLMQP